jgi:hypothetical protein
MHHGDIGNICPGSCIKVEGRGNCSGQLVAEEIKSRGCDCAPACPSACAPEPACPTPCNPCANSYH